MQRTSRPHPHGHTTPCIWIFWYRRARSRLRHSGGLSPTGFHGQPLASHSALASSVCRMRNRCKCSHALWPGLFGGYCLRKRPATFSSQQWHHDKQRQQRVCYSTHNVKPGHPLTVVGWVCCSTQFTLAWALLAAASTTRVDKQVACGQHMWGLEVILAPAGECPAWP